MSGLAIIDPGLATSLQDEGRTGFLRYGVPACGAMDIESMRLANALVDNPRNMPVLEMRFLGPSFTVTADKVRVAFCGATMTVRIERAGESIEIGRERSVVLLAADKVTIGPLRGSSTACMAVEGGFAAEMILGSAASDAKSAISGFGTAKIEAGATLPTTLDTVNPRPDMALPGERSIGPDALIHVVMGPQDDYFTEEALATFATTEWTVSSQADRMGLRLDGPVLQHLKGYDIASDGIANGAIQVPGSGQPIVLLADRQTSGGYPKIATIVSSDLPRMGRMAPGSSIRFKPVSAADAIALVRTHETRLQGLIASIGPYHPPGEIDLAALASGNIISAPVGMD